MNPATAFATVFVDELARCGVREAVLSPGSWSTPLALAFAEHNKIRLHVRIDERSAGFCALGLAKASGQVVPVLCTSGTAAANLHPAVVEADHAAVPLLVLTADRPPEMRGSGASQTIDQLHLYGNAVRMFTEVGVRELHDNVGAYWRSLACRAAFRAAHTADPGPVHLNCAFRRPLTPDGAANGHEHGNGQLPDVNEWLEPLDGRQGDAPWTHVTHDEPTPVDVDAPPRGLILAGEGTHHPSALVAFAEAAGWPIIAEPHSNARRGPNALVTGSALLESETFVDAMRPDVVITAGRLGVWPERPGIARALRLTNEHIVVSPGPQWPDAARTATCVVPALGRPVNATPDSSWLDAWRRADEAACEAFDETCRSGTHLNELLLARELGQRIPGGALLFVGPSMPIRDLDLTLRPRDDVRILANRGASGMDGVVSSAVGAALAHQRDGGGSAYALVGDLTFLHDQNGLIIGPDEPRPDLTIIVASNDGGALFSFLPQASTTSFERIFGTPTGTKLAHIAYAHSIPYERVSSLAELAHTLDSPDPGLRLVEVPSDRQENTRQHKLVEEAIRRAVSL